MSTETLSLLHNLLTLVIGVIAAPLARALTALLKRRLGTSGVTTIAMNAALSALVSGVFAYALGAYGHGVDGLVRAIASTLLTVLTAAGTHAAAQQASVSGLMEIRQVIDPPLAPATPDGTSGGK